MKKQRLRAFCAFVVPLAIVIGSLAPVANADEDCPVSIPDPELLGEAATSRVAWFGSDSFAVRLARDGVWRGMGRERDFFDKLFWHVAGFRPGMEDKFSVSGRLLNDDKSSSSPLFDGATNARLDHIGWSVLTGLGFPATGCWEVTGSFKGQDLTFVVSVEESH